MFDCDKYIDSELISFFIEGVNNVIGCFDKKYGRYFYVAIFPILQSLKNPEEETKDCLQNYYLKLLHIKKEDRKSKLRIDPKKNHIKNILRHRIVQFAIDHYRKQIKKEQNPSYPTIDISNKKSEEWDALEKLVSQQNMEAINTILKSDEEIEYAQNIAAGYKRAKIEELMKLPKGKGRVLQQKIKRKLIRANIKNTNDIK